MTLIALLVGLMLADVLWMNACYVREQHRADGLELDLWADLHGTRGRPIPLVRPPQLALGQITAPTEADLAEWDTAVDGMDWYHPWGQPADVRSEVDDQGATIHRIATRVRVGEALERACRRISTDELEALVS